ncbi:unnamed protein product [Linum trigynum]|uniref:Uncharacterized protein n=1 Tax=Linum trigynum TaxID=586398 RepID=A0AAV2GQR4_9ROSI
MPASTLRPTDEYISLDRVVNGDGGERLDASTAESLTSVDERRKEREELENVKKSLSSPFTVPVQRNFFSKKSRAN